MFIDSDHVTDDDFYVFGGAQNEARGSVEPSGSSTSTRTPRCEAGRHRLISAYPPRCAPSVPWRAVSVSGPGVP